MLRRILFFSVVSLIGACGVQDGLVADEDPTEGFESGAGVGSTGSGQSEGKRSPWARLPGAEQSGWEPVETEWCREGWLGLDEHTCFYVPQSNPEPDSVLMYLHGMMPPDASSHSQQWLVEQAAESLGVVALFPRGRAGLCSWDDSVLDWYCWPSSQPNVDAHAESFADEWTASTDTLEQLLDTELTHYVMGFSNGGYFASYVGLENLWPVAGVGLVGAGRSYIDDTKLGPEQPPMYIAVGAQDIQSVQNSAQNLAYFLYLQDWPHQYQLHSNRGHEIWPDDFEAAAEVWSQ